MCSKAAKSGPGASAFRDFANDKALGDGASLIFAQKSFGTFPYLLLAKQAPWNAQMDVHANSCMQQGSLIPGFECQGAEVSLLELSILGQHGAQLKHIVGARIDACKVDRPQLRSFSSSCCLCPLHFLKLHAAPKLHQVVHDK